MPNVNIPTLAQDLTALKAANLGQVLAQLRGSRDSLQTQILAGINATPPLNTTGLSNDFFLVNAWIRTLEAAVQTTPAPNSDSDLLAAMQAVDAGAANSAGLNSLLVAVDGAVKSFKRA